VSGGSRWTELGAPLLRFYCVKEGKRDIFLVSPFSLRRQRGTRRSNQPNAAPHQPPPRQSLPPAVPSQPSPERQRRIQARNELLAVLRVRWPQAFPTNIHLVKPHALGIHREILQRLPGTRQRILNATLQFYKRWGQGAYWRVVANGGPRYNLDGIPTGAVTEQDKEHARRELRVLEARWKARRTGQEAQASLSAAPAA